MRKLAVLAVAGMVMVAGPVWAGAEKAPQATAAAKKEGAVVAKDIDPLLGKMHSADNPYVKVIEQRARALVAPLSQPQMQELYKLREAYGLIRSVEIVQRDIKRAAKFCGEDNPDMKKEMDESFAAWDGQVAPVLKDKMGALQASIDAQDFSPPKRIREYFKSLDDAAVYAEKKFDKRVITTPEACSALKKSMGATAGQIAARMGEIKIPEFAKKAE